MRIKEFHIYHHDLPVKNGPYTMSHGPVWSLETTLVQLVTEAGVDGWGEVCPIGPLYAPVQASGVRALLNDIGAGLIGVELSVNAVQAAIDGMIEGGNYARSAVDIAVHDALGRSLGVSVATLLGGAYQTRLPSYYATGIGTPEGIAALALEKVDEGYPRIQIKAGGRDVAEDIATLRKVHEVIGHRARVLVDPNRGMSASDALRLSRECQDIPFVLEQPCNTIEEIARIRPMMHHPIHIDESMVDLNTVLRLVGDGLVDGFGMKISRLGGLRPASTFRDIAAVRRMTHSCEDSWGGDIVNAACAHLGATVRPDLLEGVWLAQPYIEGHYDPTGGVAIEGGHIQLPDGPGLGVRPDPALFGAAAASFGG